MSGRLARVALQPLRSHRNLWTQPRFAQLNGTLESSLASYNPSWFGYGSLRGLVRLSRNQERGGVVDETRLRESLYAITQLCTSEIPEHYPIAPPIADVHPRDLYLTLRARCPMHAQRVPKETLGELFRFAVDNHWQMPLLPQLILDDLLVMLTWDPETVEVLEDCLRHLALRREYYLIPKSKIVDVWERLSEQYKDVAPPTFVRGMLHVVIVAFLGTDRHDEATLSFIGAAYTRLFLRGPLYTPPSQENHPVQAQADDPEADWEPPASRTPNLDPAGSPAYIRTAYQLIHHLTAHSEAKLALTVFQHLVSHGYFPSAAMDHSTNQVPIQAEAAPPISPDERFQFVLISTLVKSCLHFGFYDLAYDFMRTLKSKAIFDSTYRGTAYKVVQTLLLSGTAHDAELLAGLVTAWAQDTASVQPLPDEVIWMLYDFCFQVTRPDLLVFIYERLSVAPHEETYPLPHNIALVALLTHLNVSNKYAEARSLVRSLIRHNYRIDPMFRADVIHQTSKMGFATEARALYEKYEHRTDNIRVVGHARMVIELVTHFVRIAQDKKTAGAKGGRDAELFARRVKNHYIRSKGELAEQPRATLNAMAHVHFLLGDLDFGFHALRILLTRKEVPDQRDVNVLLTAAAKYSPRIALTLLQSALREGYKAGARGWAILLHHAQRVHDYHLAEEILALATQEGEASKLDTTVKDSVIRGELEPFATDKVEFKREAYPALRSALITMQVMRKHGQKVEDALVHLAIRAAVSTNHLALAFSFWRDFFSGRSPDQRDPWRLWERILLKEIDRAVRRKKIPFEEGSSMLATLKATGVLKGKIPTAKGEEREIMPFLPNYRTPVNQGSKRAGKNKKKKK